MTLEEMKVRKKEAGLSNRQLSELSGVPVGTIDKLFSGRTASPRYATLQALERVLFPAGEKKPDRSASYTELLPEAVPSGVKETPARYRSHRQGQYTLADYLALPDERRVELIDGVFYDMSAPSIPHQTIAGFLYLVLSAFIRSGKGGCRAFIAPTDVQLDCDEKTILQPDVMIVCDRSKITYARIFGAPDFVAEVLSPSTRKKDLTLKVQKYANAGVREYWCIEPDSKLVYVYWFDGYTDGPDHPEAESPAAPFLSVHSFEEEIPVLIYDGTCTVCFKELEEELAEYNR